MAIDKEKTGVLIHMDKELKAKLKELAKENSRSLTGYIHDILKKHTESIPK